jgi:hypothetical protein
MKHPDSCAGCIHGRKRFKWSRPRIWCAKLEKLHEVGCTWHQTKRPAIAAALDYYKRLAIK